MENIPHRAGSPFKYGETDARLTGSGGVAWLRLAAERRGMPKLLKGVKVKRRRRGVGDGQMLLAAVPGLGNGGRSLSDVDDLRADEGLAPLLGPLPGSRRLGEFLARVGAGNRKRLQEACGKLSSRMVARAAKRCMDEMGHVPVFIDGTTLELEGHLFEGAERGYEGVRCLRLTAVHVGSVLASVRLHEGTASEAGCRMEHLREVLPMLPADSRPWLLGDNAYYCGDVVAFCRAHGWDYTISVSHDGYRRPVLDEGPASKSPCWEKMDDSDERGIYVRHAPGGWKGLMAAGWEGEDYLVIESRVDRGGQLLLEPRHAVILTSRSDVAPQSVADIHRSKQRCENSWKGLLEDLGPHHPRCRALEANRVWLCCAHLAHLLLRTLQFEVLPDSEYGRSIGALIRRWMRSAAQLVRRGRRWHLLFPRGGARIGWHRLAAARFGLAR